MSNNILDIAMSNNLHPILLIQFDIFKHEEKKWNKIILYVKIVFKTYKLTVWYIINIQA